MSDVNEIRAKWVAALRSGEYQQASKRLRRDDTFCCLGVLCDLYMKETGKGIWNDEDTGDYVFNLDDLGGTHILSSEVQEWAGLRRPAGDFGTDSDESDSLSGQNDRGVSFSIIADIIESKPEGLFND